MPIPRVEMREIGGLARSPYNPKAWPVEQFATALHEAAHAVVAMSLGQRVTEVKLWRVGDGPYMWNGVCRHQFRQDDPLGVTRPIQAAIITAAPMAAMTYTDGATRRAEGDWWGMVHSDATSFDEAYRAVADSRTRDEWERECIGIAKRHLEANARALEVITLGLLEWATVTEDDLRTMAPHIATTWETYDVPTPTWTPPSAPRSTPAQTNRPGPRRTTTRDLIPGLRYSEPVALTIHDGHDRETRGVA